MTDATKQILIPRPLAVQLLDYLKTKPWEEVNPLVNGLLAAPAAIIQDQLPGMQTLPQGPQIRPSIPPEDETRGPGR